MNRNIPGALDLETARPDLSDLDPGGALRHTDNVSLLTGEALPNASKQNIALETKT